MSKPCSNCRQINPASAIYCGNCGALFAQPIPRRTCCSGWSVAPIVLLLVVVFGLSRFPLKRTIRRVLPASWSEREQELPTRRFELPVAEADAMYALLAPDDVRVVVGRVDHGLIGVRGTEREIEVLGDLVSLMRRVDERGGTIHPQFERSCTKAYSLTLKRASRLGRVLELGHISFDVTKGGRRLVVEASKADQETVARVVRILEGERLR